MGRQPCCDNIGFKRGPWTTEEDEKLMSVILNNGIQCWRQVPKLAGLLRCGKSCRLRWINYLRPDVKRGALTEIEEDQIIQLHSRLSNRWSKIASHFPGRTDNEIKNHWNTRIKRRTKVLGLDAVTHKTNWGKRERRKDFTVRILHQKQRNFENLKSMDFSVNQKEEDEFELGSDETNYILNGNGSMEGSLDVKSLSVMDTDTETNPFNSCISSSFSLEDTLNLSIGGCTSLEEESLQHWVDTLDSLLTFDGFHHLDDIFSLENPQ